MFLIIFKYNYDTTLSNKIDMQYYKQPNQTQRIFKTYAIKAKNNYNTLASILHRSLFKNINSDRYNTYTIS